jgi:hypothetical protein
MIDPRYPIGPFSLDLTVTDEDRARYVEQIAALPAELRTALDGVSAADLERTYRPGGWSVRQVVHHVADSHLNGYVRCKLALTEERPTIKPYEQQRWAELADVALTPIEVSLVLLEAAHRRWVTLLRTLRREDFARCYLHPEHGRAVPLDVSCANYAWHGRHHTAHVRLALGR